MKGKTELFAIFEELAEHISKILVKAMDPLINLHVLHFHIWPWGLALALLGKMQNSGDI